MGSRTAVLTGGASGLDLVTARHLNKAGQSIVLVGRDTTHPGRRRQPAGPGPGGH
ncbi:hypothetical protein ACH4KT_09545 [Streptomyces anulatus]